MSIQYFCENERRRQAIQDHGTLNGIDYLEVLDADAPADSPRQRTLLVRFLKALPAAISAANVRIEGGVRVTPVQVAWAGRAADAGDLHSAGRINEAERDFLLAQAEPERLLVVRTRSAGDFSTYHFRLATSPTEPAPPAGFDPILARVAFSFKVECPDEFDCATERLCPPHSQETPAINYTAKDFAGFRKLILDRLAVIMPDWQERNPADIGIMLVEVLAYAGDYLSYFQDAAATESYLGTARRRTSLRRHARLLDYPMHDGCNARAWIAFQVDAGGDGASLPQVDPVTDNPTRLLTRVPEAVQIPDDRFERVLGAYSSEVFELMHDIELHQSHNEIHFYTWGDEACCLPASATQATLDGAFPELAVGDVLIFLENRGVESGKQADADPAHRHAVRLTSVRVSEDPLGGRFQAPPTDDPRPVTRIEWDAADSLPFPLCLHLVNVPAAELAPGEPPLQPVSVVLGNVALVDHGRTIAGEQIAEPSGHRRYRPRLSEQRITHRVPYGEQAARQPATVVSRQDPRQALPAVSLLGGGERWTPQRDLLNSDRFAPDFVVEMENDRRGRLRFGDGKSYGRSPVGTSFAASYRIGSGSAGNVGADAIVHVVTNVDGITAVRNPLPAQGGVDPESLEEVRLYAPQAFRTQERAVTEEDYAQMAARHPDVQKAMATRRWTGSWYTLFITVDRKGGRPVTPTFQGELRTFLERFRLAGHDLKIDAPRFVPLEIVMTVCVKPGYFQSEVKEALLHRFSNRDLPDGRRGYFHPDNFTFGQPVYLSRIVAETMDLPGVRWVDVDDSGGKPNRFRRWGEEAHHEIQEGVIEMARLEIARLDNDPSLPENGKISFIMEGGL
jgi:hypothetical protein